LFEATTIVGMAPIYYVYNFLLCILQVLHIFWFLTIVRMAKSFIVSGKVDIHTHLCSLRMKPSAGSGVVRIDPLHFLAGCCTR